MFILLLTVNQTTPIATCITNYVKDSSTKCDALKNKQVSLPVSFMNLVNNDTDASPIVYLGTGMGSAMMDVIGSADGSLDFNGNAFVGYEVLNVVAYTESDAEAGNGFDPETAENAFFMSGSKLLSIPVVSILCNIYVDYNL